jgi:hypothetical protein
VNTFVADPISKMVVASASGAPDCLLRWPRPFSITPSGRTTL